MATNADQLSDVKYVFSAVSFSTHSPGLGEQCPVVRRRHRFGEVREHRQPVGEGLGAVVRENGIKRIPVAFLVGHNGDAETEHGNNEETEDQRMEETVQY